MNFATPVADHRRHRLRGLVLRAERQLRRRQRLLRQHRRRQRPAPPARERRQRRQRRVPLRLDAAASRRRPSTRPTTGSTWCSPPTGGLRRHDAADGHRHHAGAAARPAWPASTTVTATFSEAMDAATVNAHAPSSCATRPTRWSRRPSTYDAATRTATLTPERAAGRRRDLHGDACAAARPTRASRTSPATRWPPTLTWTLHDRLGRRRLRAAPMPIVAENCLTGQPAERVGHRRRRRPEHPGLRDRHQRQPRQTVRFKVDTNATSYRLDIYRMGYYGGTARARSPRCTPSAALPQNQPNCLTRRDDRPDRLRQLGGVRLVGRAGRRAISGIYFAKARAHRHRRREPHRLRRARRRRARRTAVPDLRHHLAGVQQLRRQQPLHRARRPGRAYKVSYNRPFNTRVVDSGQDWLFNAEYPMVRWLEANGYDVSYITGVDTDRARRA